MYKCFNKKHSIVDTNAKTQTRFALMTMHDVSKYKKSNPNCTIQYAIMRYVSQAIAYSAKIETVREEVFVFLSVTILILIGGVTLIKMILNFWL